MKTKPQISFIVPALNEDNNIEQVVAQISTASAGRVSECEIILIDDGSTDRTGQLMDEMARRDPRIRVVHNEKNLGLGLTYRKGVALARLEYVMGIWGDNIMPTESLVSIIERAGEADVGRDGGVDERVERREADRREHRTHVRVGGPDVAGNERIGNRKRRHERTPVMGHGREPRPVPARTRGMETTA